MRLRSAISACMLAFTCLTAPALSEPQEVGAINFSFDAAHRDRLVQSVFFYPAGKGGYPEWLGDNAVFRGVRVKRDAKPDGRKHPLIIVSHGSGGNAANLAWLATRLAEQGFAVVIPNHQGSTSSDSTPETTIPAVWNRPADISRLIDAMTASPSMSALADMSDVTALGFSLGGLTALSLAGAEVRAEKLAEFCDNNPETIGCPWLAKGNALIPGRVDLHKIDAARFNARYPDSRIKRFVAIDPGFAPAFAPESLEAVKAPVQIINLGTEDTFPTGLSAKWIAAAIEGARYDTVAEANHFDFLAECKRLGWFFIWMEGDDPVCSSEGSRARAELHEEIARKILVFLKPEAAEQAVGGAGAALDSRDRLSAPAPKS